jgi:hypothetical protein
MTYRIDLENRTRDLTHKIEGRESLMKQLDQKVSALLSQASASGKEPENLGLLNDQRIETWQELKGYKAEYEKLEEEKRKLLVDAGLDPTKLPITLKELPCTQSELHLHLGNPGREQYESIMRTMIHIGLVPRIAMSARWPNNFIKRIFK